MAGRWGSFISGLESKLDTILAEEDTAVKSKGDGSISEQAETKGGLAVPAMPKGKVDGPARSSSSNRTQDRLNERLAKAMANRASKTEDNSIVTSNATSRAASPANVTPSPRASSDLKAEDVSSNKNEVHSDRVEIERGAIEAEPTIERNEEPPASTTSPMPLVVKSEQLSVDSDTSPGSTKQSLEGSRALNLEPNFTLASGLPQDIDLRTPAEYQEIIEQMRSDYEAAELRRQEEMHEYLERIDALQSKLQYLTKEAADLAKNASSTAAYGSTEHKLATKDEKIALLMEEGHKLSQTELKHMSIIKKLRGKSIDDEKQLAESRRLVENQDRNLRDLQERAKKAEAAERRATERSKSLANIEKDLENMRDERDRKTSLIETLRKEISDSRTAAREADLKTQEEALDVERKQVAGLRDELSKTKLEKEMTEKDHLVEIRKLKEKIERDNERSRTAAIERQGEQNILESRLEKYRARAEEASAGSTGDAQAKLLRQIETLQNQYAVASGNWQGIEASLLARVGSLEKERDEVSRREADVRRKARETNLRSRRVEEDFDRATSKAQDLQYELTQQSKQLISLQEKLSKADAEVTKAKKEFQAEREAWEASQTQRVEEEKARHREELPRTPDALYQHFPIDSPAISSRNRKGSNQDRHSPHGRRYHGLAMSGVPMEQPVSRRSSTHPLHSADIGSLSRQNSTTFTHPSPVNGTQPETPSITVHDQDDLFDGVQTPISQENTINDVISVSTGGAGPSVLLVERMSAAVRRLESEKAASKDELARILQQRDEAREQVVSYMREAEEKRKVDQRIKALEKDNQGIQERYLTTLEMLGEKSEKVEELKADVTDLKQMYRELVDSTMK